MRNRLNVAIATAVALVSLAVFAPVALASPGKPQAGPGKSKSHGHGKGRGHHGHGHHHGWPKPPKPPKLTLIDMSKAGSCDFIANPGNPLCLLPFPNDYNTVADPSSETGRRVNFTAAAMPANALGDTRSTRPPTAPPTASAPARRSC